MIYINDILRRFATLRVFQVAVNYRLVSTELSSSVPSVDAPDGPCPSLPLGVPLNLLPPCRSLALRSQFMAAFSRTSVVAVWKRARITPNSTWEIFIPFNPHFLDDFSSRFLPHQLRERAHGLLKSVHNTRRMHSAGVCPPASNRKVSLCKMK